MTEPNQDDLLRAIAPHVPFDGWSEASFAAAAADLGLSREAARAICPRGALDLAVLAHRKADAAMKEAMAGADLGALRYRDKVAHAIWLRLEAIEDPEAVRRSMALLSLPQHAPEGTGLVWETADAIWTALGDSSRDVNWYSKRATLSAVWGSVVLYWLGDASEGKAETRAFIDRRIDNVMQIEKAKAQIRDNRLLSAAFSPLTALASRIRAPEPRDDMPGPRAPRPMP